ncbi:hypothetical protein FRC02_003640 [Tulasnella sp. 418]|nr:hypothetical protein FRC02_003640 [Tulasnella sp. 418]
MFLVSLSILAAIFSHLHGMVNARGGGASAGGGGRGGPGKGGVIGAAGAAGGGGGGGISGLILGIIIGCVAVVIIICALGYWYFYRCAKKEKAANAAATGKKPKPVDLETGRTEADDSGTEVSIHSYYTTSKTSESPDTPVSGHSSPTHRSFEKYTPQLHYAPPSGPPPYYLRPTTLQNTGGHLQMPSSPATHHA